MHVSLSFLYSTTLASALYLLMLRYLHRQYKEVVRLVDTVGTDAALTSEERGTPEPDPYPCSYPAPTPTPTPSPAPPEQERNILEHMTCEKNAVDSHPDAVHRRLKTTLYLRISPYISVYLRTSSCLSPSLPTPARWRAASRPPS